MTLLNTSLCTKWRNRLPEGTVVSCGGVTITRGAKGGTLCTQRHLRTVQSLGQNVASCAHKGICAQRGRADCLRGLWCPLQHWVPQRQAGAVLDFGLDSSSVAMMHRHRGS